MTKNWKEQIDVLVRDITKVGSIPKSEVRGRILELLAQQVKDMFGGKDSELIQKIYETINCN